MVFAPAVAANASVSVGGWTALDTITAGATNTINAVKGAGATGMRSAVSIAPSAVKVGKHLIKGGGAAALLFAIPQILGDGVEWVLDPANNRIIYKVPDNSAGDVSSSDPYYWLYFDNEYKTADAACRAAFGKPPAGFVYVNASLINGGASADCNVIKPDGTAIINNTVHRSPNPAYDPSAPPSSSGTKDMYLPIADAAAKVIANAEAGHAPSQEAVKATALEGFAAGEHDAALDAAAVPDTGVENPTDPTDPPKDPAAPFDPAGIISAINALKALLAGILSSITGLSDIFNSDPPPEKTQNETDVPIDDLPPTKGASEFDINYINFGGQCPVLPSFNIGIGGASSALTFDMTPLCDMAVKIRPAVIAIAYFIGLGVIASAIRET